MKISFRYLIFIFSENDNFPQRLFHFAAFGTTKEFLIKNSENNRYTPNYDAGLVKDPLTNPHSYGYFILEKFVISIHFLLLVSNKYTITFIKHFFI